MALTTLNAFPQAANIGAMSPLLSTAMTNTIAYDGTQAAGTSLVLVYTAGVEAINQITKIRAQYTSTAGATASGTTSATVLRLWLNNGSANTTAANNQLLGELLIPAATLVALATAVNPVLEFSLNIPNVPANHRIFAGLTVALGGTNCALLVTGFGGNY